MTGIRIKPRHDTLEACRFDGARTDPPEITEWFKARLPRHRKPGFHASLSSGLNLPTILTLGSYSTEFVLYVGDWLVWDGNRFSVCPADEFNGSYVTPMEKVILEGLE